MAAAEYFASTPNYSSPHASSPYLNPPQPQRTSSGPIPTNRPQQGQPQAPPSYHTNPPEQRPGVHFAPSPAGAPPVRHSFSGQHRPSFSTTPPQNSYFPQQRPHQGSWSGPTSQAFHPPPPPTSNPVPGVPYGTPPAQNGYAPAPTPPHMRPYMNQNHSQYSLDNGYSSDPEPQRRRSKHKERHYSEASRDLRGTRSSSHHHHSRSTNSDAFFGAAGGGLIGDLIFPGLGTLGGAALGWIGGKDYGNHRKWREEKRERDQKGWQDKFGHRDHHHHSSSHHRGQSHERQREGKERRHSHDN